MTEEREWPDPGDHGTDFKWDIPYLAIGALSVGLIMLFVVRFGVIEFSPYMEKPFGALGVVLFLIGLVGAIIKSGHQLIKERRS